MKIIIGLGNPEEKYTGTRHNIGFDVIDRLASEYNIGVMTYKHRALIGTGVIDGVKVVLAKPQTYMNLSGESVRELVGYYKVDPAEDIIIIHDDVSLPVGQLRIRKKGSAGGHNGLKSIIAAVGDSFCRVKFGVGEKPPRMDLADYVLGHFPQEEWPVIKDGVVDACAAVKVMITKGPDEAMNVYNRKKD